jgi:two-component system nitrogen regulation sensor histidine kinase NtrY
MERVAEGDDAVQVAAHGPQELERLIHTFNVMAGELSRSRRELAQAERLAAWREVALRVAHEIKNALTPITFSVHRLRKEAPAIPEPSRERVQSALEAVMGEVDGLKRLAASFSELARLPMAELAPLDVGDLLEAAADGFSGSGRDILLEPPVERMMVNGDRALLRQALTNLIKNAVEASSAGGRIWLRASREGSRIGITVEDEGPGWPEGTPDAVLEPYFTTKADGTGLGLSLVQRTALQHGGATRLDDRPGGGARVTLLLPETHVPSGDGRSRSEAAEK